MKSLYLMIIVFCIALEGYAQAIFIRSGNGTTTAYRSLDSVMANCLDGDTIYMPGGTFQVGTVSIAKKVSMYGAGHYPDSAAATGRTVLNGELRIIGPASGSMLQGFYLSGNIFLGTDGNNSNLNGLVIYRCSFNDITLAANDGFNSLAVNVLIRENVVRSNINFRFAKDILIENCLINGGLYNLSGSVKVSNNIIFGGSSYCLYYVSSSLFENNIFYQVASFQFNSASNTFRNNVFRQANPLGGADISEQNLFSVTNLFMVPNTAFDYTGNYHLAAGSPAIHAGKGGTDCGIYGGPRPYKEAAVPSNPHIRSKTIGDNTNPSGQLQVQATVVAQGN